MIERFMQRTAQVCVAVSVLAGALTFAAEPTEIEFNRNVRPILSNNCFQCHGPDAEHREADLRLDIESEAKSSAITPGEVESELIARILSEDADVVMPPPDSGKELAAEQKQTLITWIKQGAMWRRHWAYEPPRQHAIPNSTSNSRHWIDHFIVNRLQKEGLAALADR